MKKLQFGCETQQLKIPGGIVHGVAPENGWDYLILAVSLAIFILTLFYSIKFLVMPGERSDDHIKHFILNDE